MRFSTVALNSSIVAVLVCGLSTPVAVASTPSTPPQFVEEAAARGLDFVHFNGMTGKLYFPEMTGGSVALFDYDGDGDLDVYFGQDNLYFDDTPEMSILPSRYPHPVTDRLYRNELISEGGDGELRFTDVTEEVGLAVYGNNMGIAAGDIDNDGDVDLYLTNSGPNHLLRNDGGKAFVDIVEASGTDDDRWSVAAAFFDYDHDGFLDLAVGNYVEFREGTVKDCTGNTGALDYCGPQSYPPLGNRLLRNRGDGTFEDVTIKAWVDARRGSTLGLVAADFNRDGWIDLYVANDLMANELWINQKDGTFLDDAMFSGAAVDMQGLAQASMGVVAGDFNGDGAEDLFMSHLSMEMNTLYLNDGQGMFRDASRESGLGLPSWSATGFGTSLGDFDHDGWLDLYVGNGAVKRVEAQKNAQEKHPLREPNSFYRGTGSGNFVDVPAAERVDVVHSEVTRGVATGDLDNDGDLDLVLANNGGPARLLRNTHIENATSTADWVGFRVLTQVGSTSTGEAIWRDAIGAAVTLETSGERDLVRRVRTDGSYAAASDPRVHFGVAGSKPESVVVWWPSGEKERFAVTSAGRYHDLRQGEGSALNGSSAAKSSGGAADDGAEGAHLDG